MQHHKHDEPNEQDQRVDQDSWFHIGAVCRVFVATGSAGIQAWKRVWFQPKHEPVPDPRRAT
jgi:hypothetical protein